MNSLVQYTMIVCALLLMGVVSTHAQTAPPAEETIDLKSFRSRSGQTLFEAAKGHSLVMVVMVSPNCDTCTKSREIFEKLKARVNQPKIPYFVVMLSDGTDKQKYFDYADSLKLGVESFVWSSTETKAPALLTNMAVPSHLMVTNEGLVVNKWPGANQIPQ